MPRTRLVLLAAILAMVLTTSCSRSSEKESQAEHQQGVQQARAADEAAIRAASAAWSQAATAKDLDKSISFYADDALQLPNKAPAAKGKENIRKNWAPMLALPGPGLSWQTSSVEVARSGDIGRPGTSLRQSGAPSSGRPAITMVRSSWSFRSARNAPSTTELAFWLPWPPTP